MKNIFILLTLFLATYTLFSQVAPDKYYVQFTDKNNSPYSIDNPSSFLSQRAIARRTLYGIQITNQDIPVNPEYINGVAATGVTILNPTKWLNGLTIFTNDSLALDAIAALTYVANIRGSGKKINKKHKKPFLENESIIESASQDISNKSGEFDYGASYNQINMISGISLHESGFLGQGMVISVLDAGFRNVDNLPVFDSLWANNQILGTKDFVAKGIFVFDYHGHGTSVLSTMGGYFPGELIGTAPKASYWLLRSEEANGKAPENIIEEYNWVSAAEFADSVGTDIINSSLGYTTFDDATQDHTYADMDGNTTPITIGADIAASKGILVVNSAGNSGGDLWHYIGAPADGDSVFTIGAVSPDSLLASFSSRGPTVDGRTKPNIAAQGSPAWVASSGGNFANGYGTSFSSPIIAGMCACLWQSNPNSSNMDIINALQQSASYYTTPNDDYGYGIPNFAIANELFIEKTNFNSIVKISPNPCSFNLQIIYLSDKAKSVLVEVFDITGKLIISFNKNLLFKGNTIISLPNIKDFTSGMYVVRIISDDDVSSAKFIKY